MRRRLMRVVLLLGFLAAVVAGYSFAQSSLFSRIRLIDGITEQPAQISSTGLLAVTTSAPVTVAQASSTSSTYPRYRLVDGTTENLLRINSSGQVHVTCAICGDTSQPLSQFAATTSAQLAGIMSNETGTGLLVFNDTPTLLTPNIGGGAVADARLVSITSAGTATIGQSTAFFDLYSTANLPIRIATNSTVVGTFDTAGNFGLGSPTFGTSAAKAIGLATGTAPSTFPAGGVQAVAVNALGAATAGLKVFGELGDSHLFGNNHYTQHQVTKPTVSATNCGTTPVVENGSTDQALRLTVDFTGVATCVVTFNKATTNAMKCIANNETTANLTRTTASTTTVTIAGTVVTGDKLTVLCGDST